MKARPLANLWCALALGLVPSLAAAGQGAAPRDEGRLVVEVVYLAGVKPAYSSVPGGAWYGRFGSVRTPEPRAAGATVRAVDVETRPDGERVQIKVGVHVGARFHDRLEEVATYTVAPGETVVARELERVGVAPFVFKVLRVNTAALAAPTVVNQTQSVAASVTDFTPSPLPRVKLTLHNLSQKSVRAVELRTVFGGRVRTTTFAVEPDGKSLMEPGGKYEKRIGITDGHASAVDDFTPEAIESVVVAAVVFSDYTFEGDVEAALRKAGHDEGARVQLPRLLAVVRRAHAAHVTESAAAIRRFHVAVSALNDAAPEPSVEAVLGRFAALTPQQRENAKVSVEVAIHRVRAELLEDLSRFESRFRAAPAENSFGRWLEERRARYEGWLARL